MPAVRAARRQVRVALCDDAVAGGDGNCSQDDVKRLACFTHG